MSRSTPYAHNTLKPVAISKADHTKGEIGYCEFLAALPFNTRLYAAAPALEEEVASLREALKFARTVMNVTAKNESLSEVERRSLLSEVERADSLLK